MKDHLLVVVFVLTCGLAGGCCAGLTMTAMAAVLVTAPDAVEATIPINSQGYGFIEHECCGCALTHHVEVRVGEESITMYWLVDEWETKKRRRLRGIFDSWQTPGGERR